MTDFWYTFWITVVDFLYISCAAAAITIVVQGYIEEEKLKKSLTDNDQ